MDAEDMLISARLDRGEALQVIGREALFTIPPEYYVANRYDFYDVSPDGQRFLMGRVEPVEQTFGRFILVENFFEELKRLAPN